MSGLSQYQSVFRVAKSDATNGIHPRGPKRNRNPVSCTACRTRKLKCDRQTPCLPCSKRGDATSCTYFKSSRNGHERREEGSRKSEAQLRLQKLEEMVTTLMQTTKDRSENSARNTSPNKATIDQRLKDLSIHSATQANKPSSGHLDINGSETNYLGATHWETILGNIREIQGVLDPETNDTEEEAPSFAIENGLDVVLDTTQSLTLDDVCKSLPPRMETDRLLSIYFNSKYHQTPIIHNGKFLREYESFWADPSSMSFLWISILFSLLWFSVQYSQRSGQESIESPGGPTQPDFFKLAGQALVTGKYRKARPYSVEAVMTYGQCTYMMRKQPDADAWMVMSVSTRLAMRMGYHRDPRHFPSISPFEGEMRRRTFYIVQTFDFILSFQAGLPAIIHEEECDTEPPSNLFDSDFNEDCKMLPPSRPPTDPTPMLYYCYKGGFANIFGRVTRHALSLKNPSHPTTMLLDAELHAMQSNIPPSLRMRPLSAAISDEPHTIMNRLNIDLLYLSSVCVLHRIYISHDRSNPTFAYSRRTCAAAALQMLKHQADLHVSSQPGGRFFHDKWMLSNLSLHNFLLAAMVTCLDLYESRNESPLTSLEDRRAQAEQFDMLRLSLEIWTSRRSFSRDARRASGILAVMLSKVPRPDVSTTTRPVDADANADPNASPDLPDPSQISSFHDLLIRGSLTPATAAITDPPSTSPWNTNTNANTTTAFDTQPPAEDFTDPLNAMFNESDIDWGVVDQYLFNWNDMGDVSLDWELLDAEGLPGS